MRIPLIAGNWKMNKREGEAITLVRQLMQGVRSFTTREVLICPPFTSLSQIHKLTVSSSLLLGAQNISEHPEGAYTGEISPGMVAEFCTHVILGHSERRAYYGEGDDLVNRKVKAALQVGLIPVLCVGELLEERENGQTAARISAQLKEGLREIQISSPSQLIIAYEPVWAIGTGLSASAQETSDLVGGVVRTALSSLWGEDISQGIRVLYGGSVNPGNAGEFFNQDEIDGALVGGASLTAENFLGIIERA